MKSDKTGITSMRALSLLLGTTFLTALPATAYAQDAAAPAPQSAPQADTIRSITVNGAQRLEADTIRSYIRLRIGDTYTQQAGDQAL